MEKSNKIIHIIWSLNQGGAEKMLLELAGNDKLNSIIVISGKKNDYESTFKNIAYLEGNYFKKIVQILTYSKNTPVVLWMYKSICYCFPVLFLRKTCSTIHHDLKFLSREKISTKISILLTLLFHKLSKSHFIFVSNSSLENHVKIGFSKSKASVIPNGTRVILNRPMQPLKTITVCV